MNNEVFDYMKVNKNSLKNIIKDNNIINILHDAIFRVNKIIFHTYNFLKLYILYLYDNNLSIPPINEHFIRIIMKIISIQNDNRGRIPNKKTIKIINKLTIFFDNHYKKTIDSNDIIYSDKLSSTLSYEAIDIVKNINTNISSLNSSNFLNWVCVNLIGSLLESNLINRIEQAIPSVLII